MRFGETQLNLIGILGARPTNRYNFESPERQTE
jgi:hypothetical protein